MYVSHVYNNRSSVADKLDNLWCMLVELTTVNTNIPNVVNSILM